MAWNATGLTNGSSNANAAAYATASVSLVAGRLYFVVVSHCADQPSSVGTTATSFSLIGAGESLAAENPDRSLFVYQAIPGSNDTDVIDIAFAGGQARCAWDVIEITGHDSTGTIVQSAYSDNGEAASTGFAVSLGAFGDAGNATFGAFMHIASELSSPGTGFTELTDDAGGENQGHMTQFRADNDTSVDASWATSVRGIGFACEIKAAGGGGGSVSGSGSGALRPIAGSGSGDVDVSGSGSGALRPIAGSGSGDVDVSGSGSGALRAFEAVGSGDVDVAGSGSSRAGPIAASGAGTVTSGPTGSGTASLRTITAAGAGGVVVRGSGSGALGAVAAAGAGKALTQAAGVGSLPAVGSTGSGSVAIGFVPIYAGSGAAGLDAGPGGLLIEAASSHLGLEG